MGVGLPLLFEGDASAGGMMADAGRDLFTFWQSVPADARCHPADELTLARVEHGFRLDVPPAPIKGPLKTAPVVLLALSPGFAKEDVQAALSPEGISYNARSRSGLESLPTRADHAGTARWVSRIVKQFGVEYEVARDRVAVLNIGAYHSKDFDDWHTLASLASSRASLNWAQLVLFPQAERGERVVVCLRSAGYWGLSLGPDRKGWTYGKSLFVPACTPDGTMHHGPLRERIGAAVRSAVRETGSEKI